LRTVLLKHIENYKDAEYPKIGKSSFVFHHTVSAAHFHAGERIGSLYDGFKAAVRRAKLPKNLRQHDLRHTRCTNWLAEGKSPVHVQKAMGHARIETTMGYYKFLPDHLNHLVDGNT
jgi:integrase